MSAVQPLPRSAPGRPADDRWGPRGPLGVFLPLAVLLAAMWIEELVDTVLAGRLDRYGIRPRELDGLEGVVAAPFLHAGWDHLIANTVPLTVLGALVCLSGAARFLQVTAIVALVSGVGTWLTGAEHSVHLGASGVVFGYVVYLISRGIFAHRPAYLAGGVLVLVVYGGVLWGVLPTPGISWQGHLFGAVGGLVAAWVLHRRGGVDESPLRTRPAVAPPRR